MSTSSSITMRNAHLEVAPGIPPTFIPSKPVKKVSGRKTAVIIDSTYMRELSWAERELASSSCATVALSRRFRGSPQPMTVDLGLVSSLISASTIRGSIPLFS